MLPLGSALKVTAKVDGEGNPVPFSIKFVTLNQSVKTKPSRHIHWPSAVRCGAGHSLLRNHQIAVKRTDGKEPQCAVHIRHILSINGQTVSLMATQINTASLAGGLMMSTKDVLMTTKTETYTGVTAVTEQWANLGGVARWGMDNRHPQNVIKDVCTTSLIASVIERLVGMLVSGGLQYGTIEIDPRTGLRVMKAKKDDVMEEFMEDSAIELYLYEAARDWYTFRNVFAELRMGRAYDRVVGLGCQDASHVRLSTQNAKGEIEYAYIADWEKPQTLESLDATINVLEPYGPVVRQMLKQKKARYVLPLRYLDRGQFYYGVTPWNGLRANGWLDVAKRVPFLKSHILENIKSLKYHFEINPAFWTTKYKDWNQKSEVDRLELMKTEVGEFDKWAKSEKGQNGIYWSGQERGTTGKDSPMSLVTIHEFKMDLPKGAFLQDSQEADFIICRDMGLKPSLHGISPGTGKSSNSSGSEDRVARTNHILDTKADANMILRPLKHIARLNGWKYTDFWFANYYAVTLDQSMQVGDLNQPIPTA